MLAAISPPVTPVGYSRAEPSGSVIVISGALIVSRLPAGPSRPGDDSAAYSRAVDSETEEPPMASATAELTMSASPDAVWAILRDFHGLPNWMPGIERAWPRATTGCCR